MSVLLSPVGNGISFLNSLGYPLISGKIYTYQAGSSTPLETYTDVNGTIANSNPILLGADGRVPDEIWLTYGYSYKFVVKDANDVTVQTLDNLYGILQTAPSSAPAVPSGCIMLWSGATGSIPSGWYLCNGQNGTPDLRNKFLVGAGDTYSVNQTGGSADAIVVTHTHTATSTSVVTDPTHYHTYQTGSNTALTTYGSNGNFGGGTPDDTSFIYHSSSESTGITVATTTTNASAGTSGTDANLPPYYALAYIMKA
jgi:microcystin-dependent protein